MPRATDMLMAMLFWLGMSLAAIQGWIAPLLPLPRVGVPTQGWTVVIMLSTLGAALAVLKELMLLPTRAPLLPREPAPVRPPRVWAWLWALGWLGLSLWAHGHVRAWSVWWYFGSAGAVLFGLTALLHLGGWNLRYLSARPLLPVAHEATLAPTTRRVILEETRVS